MVSFMGYGYPDISGFRFSSFYVTIILNDTGFVTLTVTEILKKYGGLSYAKLRIHQLPGNANTTDYRQLTTDIIMNPSAS